MLNLVLILLITIFLLMFFSISSPDICLVKYLVFFFLSLKGSHRSCDPGHKSKRLARVDFCFLSIPF
jgi:hypothetical protein